MQIFLLFHLTITILLKFIEFIIPNCIVNSNIIDKKRGYIYNDICTLIKFKEK